MHLVALPRPALRIDIERISRAGVEQYGCCMVEIDIIYAQSGYRQMPSRVGVILHSSKALFAVGNDSQGGDFRAHLARGRIGHQQIVFGQRRPYCRDVSILIGQILDLIVDAIRKSSQRAMSALDRLIHAAQVIHCDRLHRGSDNVTRRQHT